MKLIRHNDRSYRNEQENIKIEKRSKYDWRVAIKVNDLWKTKKDGFIDKKSAVEYVDQRLS